MAYEELKNIEISVDDLIEAYEKIIDDETFPLDLSKKEIFRQDDIVFLAIGDLNKNNALFLRKSPDRIVVLRYSPIVADDYIGCLRQEFTYRERYGFGPGFDLSIAFNFFLENKNGPVYEVVDMCCRQIIEEKPDLNDFFVSYISLFYNKGQKVKFEILAIAESEIEEGVMMSASYDISGPYKKREIFFLSRTNENDRRDAERWVDKLFK